MEKDAFVVRKIMPVEIKFLSKVIVQVGPVVLTVRALDLPSFVAVQQGMQSISVIEPD